MKFKAYIPHLDLQQLESLFDASQPQDLTWIEDLFQILTTSTPESIQKIHTAWSDRNYTELEKICHANKSTVGMIGMAKLHLTFTEIESGAKTRDELRIARTIKNLKQDYQSSIQELDHWISDLKTAIKRAS